MSSHAASADPRAARAAPARCRASRPSRSATVAFGARPRPPSRCGARGGLQLGADDRGRDRARRRRRGLVAARGRSLARARAPAAGRRHARALRRRSPRSPRCRSSGRSSPSDAWLEANRTLAYLAVVRRRASRSCALAPQRWAALLGGDRARARSIVCGYALLTKVFPGALNPDEIYARLREPFGYWNAVGLIAALGVPGVLWLGARRAGHAALNALAYPALGLLLVALLLAYSRGALLALALGCALWFAIVPLRLRGVAVLAHERGRRRRLVGRLGVRPGRAERATTSPLAERAAAGHELGLAARCDARSSCSPPAWRSASPRAQRARRAATRRRGRRRRARRARARADRAASARSRCPRAGLGGSISNGWSTLTDPNAATPPNDARPADRGRQRARALLERGAEDLQGAQGARASAPGGYATVAPALPHRRRSTCATPTATSCRRSPTSGSSALALVARAAGAPGWRRAARTVGLWPARRGARRGRPSGSGMATLLAIVRRLRRALVHRLDVVRPRQRRPRAALRRLAGRPRAADRGAVARRLAGGACAVRDAVRGSGLAVAAVAVAVGRRRGLSWQPQRAVSRAAPTRSRTARGGATSRRRAGRSPSAEQTNPLSVEPLFELAAIERRRRATTAGARSALQEAVHMQPANPATWLRARRVRARPGAQRRQARCAAVGPALYLDPRSQRGDQPSYLQASGRAATRGGTPAAPHRCRSPLAALVSPAAAPASPAQESMFQDDALLVYGTPRPSRRARSTRCAALGVDRVRVSLLWRLVAPAAGEARKPDDFDGADPGRLPARAGTATTGSCAWPSARGTWRELQRHLAGAELGDGHRSRRGRTSSDLRPERRRVRRVRARRTAAAPTPGVHYWSIWNEPNQAGWLTPQWLPDPREPTRWVRAAPPGLPPARRRRLARRCRTTGHGATRSSSARPRPRALRCPRASRADRRRCASSASSTASTTTCSSQGHERGGARLPDDQPGRGLRRRAPGAVRGHGCAHHPYELTAGARPAPDPPRRLGDDRQPQRPQPPAAPHLRALPDSPPASRSRCT